MKMCQAFSDNGHEVVLLAPDIKNEFTKNLNNIFEFYGVKQNFKIKKLSHPNFKFGAIIYLFNIFFYLFFNKRFDLVYGRFLHGCYVAAILKNLVILETHEAIFNKKNQKLFFFKKIIRYKNFKKLIVISQALKNMYLKNGYLNSSKIYVAHDGADEVLDFEKKIKLLGPKNDLKVGYVGHLYKGRGLENIIKLAKKIVDVTFHIVGGLDKDIAYWKNYTKNLRLNNIFFYGFVSPKETIKYRNSFDILLAPYEKKVTIDGKGNTVEFMSPLKIFEYMSSKKPIIASDITVVREVLNEKNSILLDYDDINSWINSIDKLRDEQQRETIANQALKDFVKYTWKNRAKLVL
jgi:glycosyltransferase involved in cell wall biosynthesis